MEDDAAAQGRRVSMVRVTVKLAFDTLPRQRAAAEV
jgi:hypothetical protein